MNLRYDMIDCYVVRPDAAGISHEFLQMRRPAGAFMGGTWQTIHGGIEAGESAWQAALRELREETSLLPLEFYQLDTMNIFYMAANDCVWHCPGFCAVVDRTAQVVMNEEHEAIRWVARATIDRDFMWPGERLALAELCREILDNGPAKEFLKLKL